MRHLVANRKLGRTSAHRKALFRNMAESLIMHERIETTLHKAKELRPLAEKLITLGKQNTLWARRQAFAKLRSRTGVHKLFDQLAPRYGSRHGGYTRIMHLGFRLGDSAAMAVIEYLPDPNAVIVSGDGKKAKPAKNKAAAAAKPAKADSAEKPAKKKETKPKAVKEAKPVKAEKKAAKKEEKKATPKKSAKKEKA